MKNRKHLNHFVQTVSVLFFLALTCVPFSAAQAYGGIEDVFERGDLAGVKRLLAKGKYHSPVEALNLAILYGRLDVVKYLASRGWLEKCRKAERCFPVNSAAASGNIKLIQFLKSKGFPITLQALKNAAQRGHLETVRFFCKTGENFDEKYGYKILEGGTWIEYTGTVHEHFQHFINKKMRYRWAPLRDARIYASYAKIVEYLGSGQCKKAPKHMDILASYTMEVKALRRGNVKAVKRFLTKRKADSIHPYVLVYQLYEAVASDKLGLVKYLNDRGWLKRCRKISYCFPQHIAALKAPDSSVLSFLIAEGFAVDIYNSEYGGTPLQYAGLAGNLNAVKLLCQKGADLRKNVMLVNLGRYPEGILQSSRRSYGGVWCEMTRGNPDAQQLCFEQTFAAHECIPGLSCRGVKFPPKGTKAQVKRILAINAVFQYLRSGQCRSPQAPACPEVTSINGSVVADKLSLRETPNINGKVISTLSFDRYIKVIDRSKGCEKIADRSGRWIKVEVYENMRLRGDRGATQGWVFDAYIDYRPDKKPRR